MRNIHRSDFRMDVHVVLNLDYNLLAESNPISSCGMTCEWSLKLSLVT
jgi:hypothetical protein